MEPIEIEPDQILYCKMCKEDKKHMALRRVGDDRPQMWKCIACGEYNQNTS